MEAVVCLAELVDELELLAEGRRGFINRRTGELYSTTDELLSKAEEGDDEEGRDLCPEERHGGNHQGVRRHHRPGICRARRQR